MASKTQAAAAAATTSYSFGSFVGWRTQSLFLFVSVCPSAPPLSHSLSLSFSLCISPTFPFYGKWSFSLSSLRVFLSIPFLSSSSLSVRPHCRPIPLSPICLQSSSPSPLSTPPARPPSPAISAILLPQSIHIKRYHLVSQIATSTGSKWNYTQSCLRPVLSGVRTGF